MIILKNQNNKQNYLILSREENIVELVNINDLKDTFYFLLEENNCPYQYSRSITEDEFILYQQKVKELKSLAEILCKRKNS